MTNRRKTVLMIIALVVLVIVALAAWFAFRPQTSAGSKAITVTVEHLEGENKVFDIKTDAEYLREALDQEHLVEGTETEYGLWVTTVDGETADDEKQELPYKPETSMTDAGEEPGYPIVHIPGITLPEQYGDGLLDCEAAFWIVNHVRELEGLEPLGRCDAVFQQASIERLNETVKLFSHTRPNGEKYSTVFAEHNITYKHSNENLACGQYTAEHVMLDWLNSDTHRANLLDPDIDRVCIACCLDSEGIPYWVFEGVMYDDSYQMTVEVEYIEVSPSDMTVTATDAQ